MKKLLFGLICQLFLSSILFAQNNVGINNPNPNASAALDVTSTTQGFLPPRMTMVQRDAIVSPAAGLIIYCTDCAPATLYLNNGNSWGALIAAAPATFVAGSLSCTGTLAGTYNTGVATNGSNTKQIVINVAGGGTYGAFTNTVNGVTFAASGVASAGSNTIVLAATGTPTVAGTFSYTVVLGGQSCSFNVTYTTPPPPATFNCNGATKTYSPAGSLTNGTAYSGTYTLPYLSGNGQAYGTTTVTSNGLTITRTAGTYSTTSGNVVYTLSGTFTGTTNTTVSFNLVEGCTVLLGDAIRGAMGTAGCASCAAYDAAAVNSWVQVTAAEYDALANVTNISGAAKAGATDANMATPGSPGFSSNFTAGGSTSYTTASPLSYIVGFKVGRIPDTDPAGVLLTNASGSKVKIGTSATGGYVTINNTLPDYTVASANFYYFISKQPLTTTANSIGYLAHYNGISGGAGCTKYSGQINYNSGDVSNIANSYTAVQQIQVIGTTIKQW